MVVTKFLPGEKVLIQYSPYLKVIPGSDLLNIYTLCRYILVALMLPWIFNWVVDDDILTNTSPAWIHAPASSGVTTNNRHLHRIRFHYQIRAPLAMSCFLIVASIVPISRQP